MENRRAEGLAQAVEHLPHSQYKILSSNYSTTKKLFLILKALN
jgi:hypothetical protein